MVDVSNTALRQSMPIYNGYGRINLEGGSIYEGEIILTTSDIYRFTGRGTLTKLNGTIYEGEFRNGKACGSGKITKKKTNYEGEWNHLGPNGTGKFTANDGSCYDGKWKDGKRHGSGTYVDCAGVTYVGEWKRGMKHGEGTETIPGKHIRAGWWENDKLIQILRFKRTPEASAADAPAPPSPKRRKLRNAPTPGWRPGTPLPSAQPQNVTEVPPLFKSLNMDA